MSWQPLDCHAHSTMSDGDLGVARLVEVVRGRGARPSVSDHISRDVRSAVDSEDAVREYLDELEEHPVARGGEFCWHDELWRTLPDDLAARFTHRLGSLHAIFLPDGSRLHAFWGDLPPGLTASSYMEALVSNLERLAAEMPVDVLAHPTLVHLAFRARDPEELWSEALEDRAVAALRSAGIAFEISNRYPPHERLVRRAAAGGVRLALGSDGHSAEQVGDIAAPLALARAVGVADTELFDPYVHGSRTLHAAAARHA